MLKKSVLKRPKYIDDDLLVYEIMLSQASGKLTKKAELMLIRLSNEIIKKFNYNDVDDKYDCRVSGLLAMLENWQKFNYRKYEKALPYFTEIFKRSAARQFSVLKNNSKNSTFKYMISLDNLTKI